MKENDVLIVFVFSLTMMLAFSLSSKSFLKKEYGTSPFGHSRDYM